MLKGHSTAQTTLPARGNPPCEARSRAVRSVVKIQHISGNARVHLALLHVFVCSMADPELAPLLPPQSQTPRTRSVHWTRIWLGVSALAIVVCACVFFFTPSPSSVDQPRPFNWLEVRAYCASICPDADVCFLAEGQLVP